MGRAREIYLRPLWDRAFHLRDAQALNAEMKRRMATSERTLQAADADSKLTERRGSIKEPSAGDQLKNLCLDSRGLALHRRRPRSVLASHCRLVDEGGARCRAHHDALMMAVWRRGKADSLLHRSDG